MKAKGDVGSLPRQLPAQPNNSLINGIECLQLIVSAERPIGSREVARRMGMTHTRVNRLIGTLAYMGLLEQDADRRYRPGPGLHALASQSMMASRLLPAALPYLVEMGREGFAVTLGTLWRGQVCFLYNERPGQSAIDAILRHELRPVDQSSIGVALLAAGPATLPLDESARVGADDLLPGQPLDVTVAAARERGYAVLRFKDGAVSVGVAIGQPPVAGLAVSRLHLADQFLPGLADRLLSIADHVAATIRSGQFTATAALQLR